MPSGENATSGHSNWRYKLVAQIYLDFCVCRNASVFKMKLESNECSKELITLLCLTSNLSQLINILPSDQSKICMWCCPLESINSSHVLTSLFY